MRILLSLAFAILVTATYAQRPQGQRPQPINITGTVIDLETGQPLEYATLVLQSVRRPDRITGGITDSSGKFEVQTLPGQYNIRVEYLGYKTYELKEQVYHRCRATGKR